MFIIYPGSREKTLVTFFHLSRKITRKSVNPNCKCCLPYISISDKILYINKAKIAIRGDGKSPDQKVIDMQLQAANLVYIFDVIILSVTTTKVEGWL